MEPRDNGTEPDDTLFEKNTNGLAQMVLIGKLTDDNPSQENGLTGLEQVICIVFGLDIQRREAISLVKEYVYREIHSLRGGCDLSKYEDWKKSAEANLKGVIDIFDTNDMSRYDDPSKAE